MKCLSCDKKIVFDNRHKLPPKYCSKKCNLDYRRKKSQYHKDAADRFWKLNLNLKKCLSHLSWVSENPTATMIKDDANYYHVEIEDIKKNLDLLPHVRQYEKYKFADLQPEVNWS